MIARIKETSESNMANDAAVNASFEIIALMESLESSVVANNDVMPKRKVKRIENIVSKVLITSLEK